MAALAAFLDERMTGRVVERVEVAAVSALKTFEPAPDALVGCRVRQVTRRGKFLIVSTDGPHLVLHLARAGWIRWREGAAPARAKPGRGPLALRLVLDGASLDVTEAGTQKRLAAYIVGVPEDVPGVAALGVDPLDPAFTTEHLARLLAGSHQQVKGVITDQRLLAGVGNAYSDEALHRARLSPFRPAGHLTPEEVAALHDAIVATLSEAVARSSGLPAAGLKDEKRAGMQVHARTGQPCPVCGDTIRQVAFADRSLQYCPTCQTGGKVLADRRLSRLLK